MAEKLQPRSKCYARMSRKTRRFIKRQQARQDRARRESGPGRCAHKARLQRLGRLMAVGTGLAS